MAKDAKEPRKPGSGSERDKRSEGGSGGGPGRLGKAIDKPIGEPDRAREEAPIGWDFGPDGFRGVLSDDSGPPAEAPGEGAGAPLGEARADDMPAEAPSEAPPAAGSEATGSLGSGGGDQLSGLAGGPPFGSGGSLSPDPGSNTAVDDGVGHVEGPDLGGGVTPSIPGGGGLGPVGPGGGGSDGESGGAGGGDGGTEGGTRPPVISGPAAGGVQEDVLVSVSGQLTASASGGASWSLVGDGASPYGSFTLGPDGSWSYALDNDKAQGLGAGDTVQAIFTVKVTDGSGETVSQVVTVTITGTNDAPIISGTTTGTVEEDAVPSVSGQLTASDVDIGDSASWSLTGSGEGAHGTLTLGDDGQWSYALDDGSVQGLKAGETVQDLFTVTVTDEAGASVTQVITVTVVGTNDEPVISGTETGAVDEDGTLSASGALTSTDADMGDSASWSLVGGADGNYGSINLSPDGSWSYTLDNDAAQGLKAGETAQEIFTVTVTDAEGASDTQTVTITVTGTNDTPVIAGTETGAVQEDEALTASGGLTVSDADIGDTAAWVVVGSGDGQYGSLVLGDDGQWSYALDNAAAQGLKAGETVQEIFTVKATDAEGASDTQTITITVSGTNDAPVISGVATGVVTEDEALTASGRLTAIDPDIGDTASWSIAGDAAGSYGALTLNPDGSWSYALNDDAAQGLKAGETAQESFTVRVTDAAGASADQVITVTVSGTNDTPVISGAGTGAVTEDETLTTSGALSVADADIGDTASWSIVGGGEGHYGNLVIGDDGAWTYKLDNDAAQGLKAGDTAQEIFTVTVTDSAGASTTQTVIVTVAGTNDAPVISGSETGAVQEDAELAASGTLTSTDADIGDSASWSLVGPSSGSYGSLTLGDDGQWSYALDNDKAQGLRAGETAQEIFTVTVTDASGASDTQTVTVTVTGTNDAPVISGTETGSVQEDETLSASGALTSTDADIGDSASWSLVGPSSGSYGALTLDEGGQWSYALDNDKAQGLRAGETAQEIFTVTVTDASGASDTQTITVTVTGTNDAPVISGAETGAVEEDGSLNASGQFTATDADIGDGASWSLVGSDDGQYGSLVLGDDGSWSYTLDNAAAQGLKAGETAQEIFTVKLTDASGASDMQTVTVTVTGTNDIPVISGTATGMVAEDGTLTAGGALTSSDADIGDTASWSLVGDDTGRYGALTLNDDGSWSYTLDNAAAQGLKDGETAQEIFTVKVTDASGASDTQTVTVIVTGTNDAPVISGTGTGEVQEDIDKTPVKGVLHAEDDSDKGVTWTLVGDGDSPYGKLSLDSRQNDAGWHYVFDNKAAQPLREGETVQEIFTVRATDSNGVSTDYQVVITIKGTNDVPVVSGATTGMVAEDGVSTAGGTLIATDIDAGDTASWSLLGDDSGRYGALTLDDHGNWSYALDNEAAQGLKAGDTAQEIFTVRVTDGAGATVDRQVTITVTGTNDAPVISGTATGTVEEGAVASASGQLSASDVDIGDSASWSLTGSGEGVHGALTLGDDGHWSYALDDGKAQGLRAGETAQDLFTVTVTDEAGASVTQVITVTVVGTNDAPVISGTETGSVAEDETLTASGALTATDADIGDSASWSLVGSANGSYGSLTLGGDGQWSYALDNDAAQGLKAGETAQEIFTVKVTDASGASDTQTVTVTVTGTNDAPVISGTATGAVAEDGSLAASGQLTSADADIGDSASWTLVGSDTGHYGGLALDDDGSWSYQLDNGAAQGLRAGETAQEIFTVKVTDASGASDTQTVTVTVTGTNDAPVISGTETGSVAEDEALSASGALTSTDPDIGDSASWSLVGPSNGGYGALTLGDDGQWSYALDNDAAQGLKAGETAQEIFTVKVTDASGASDTQTVTVTVTGTNDAPLISGAATGIVQEDEIPTVSGALASSDADIGDTASWSVAGSGEGHYGSLALGDDGAWTYTLDNGAAQGLKAGDSAQEIFTVTVTDASGASDTQIITVTVNGTNDAPVISGSATGSVDEDGIQTASGALTSADADIGDSASWSVVGDESGAYGSLTLGEDGRWSYELDNDAAQGLKAGETAQEIFTVKVTDASGASDTQTVTVTMTGSNDVPAISGVATGSVQEDGALTAGGALAVSDADIGDSASWSVVGEGAGSYGDFTLGADGHWSYALDNDKAQDLKAGETAQDIFTVKVTDAEGASTTQTITVTVSGTNDAPVIAGTASGVVAEDGTLTAGGKLDVFDADVGDSASWSVVGGDAGNYGSLTIDETGRWSYALDNDKAQGLKAGESAQESFTVRVTDAAGASAEQTITITVGGTNDVPVIAGTATGQVREDVTLTASGQLTAADADIGDSASWSIDGAAASDHGVFAIDPDSGQWTFTLDNDSAQGLKAGETIRESVTVRVTDSAGASETHLVSVEITGTNDRPHVGQALNNMGAMKEDTSVTFSAEDLLRGAQVTDIDQDNLSITTVGLSGASAPGKLVDNGNGTWTFTPDHNVSNANVGISFQVSDGHTSVNAQASVAIQPVADAAEVSISSSAEQEVIKTGPANDLGRIVAPQITTKQLTEFTLEFTVVGNSVPESTTGQGPVIVNIGSPPSDKNTLTLWDPANMKVGMSKANGSDVNIATGVDLTDGESHRVTLTWDAKTNTLRVYDNGELALTTQMPKPLPSTLYMAVAEKANTPPTTGNPSGGGYRNTEHFEGTIFNVAMSNKAETASQVKDAPLAEQMENNLLIDLRAQNDKIVDTTGRNAIKTGGAIDTDAIAVDTTLGSAPPGSIVKLDIDTGLTDPNDHLSGLVVSGFLAGTVVSDGSHSVVVTGPNQKLDITNWAHDKLTADLPDGVRTSMDLKVTATTTTPPYATGAVDAQGHPVMATDSTTTDEHHTLLVEGAGPPPVVAAEATMSMAAESTGEPFGADDAAALGVAALAMSAADTSAETSVSAPQAKSEAPAAGGGTAAPAESSSNTSASAADGSDTVASSVVDAGARPDGAAATDAAQAGTGDTAAIAAPGAEALAAAGTGSTGEAASDVAAPTGIAAQPDGGGASSVPGGDEGTSVQGAQPSTSAGGDASGESPATTEPAAAGTQPGEAAAVASRDTATSADGTSGAPVAEGGTTRPSSADTAIAAGPAESGPSGAETEPPVVAASNGTQAPSQPDGTDAVAGTTAPADGAGPEAATPVAAEPVDASGQVSFVSVNDWYNPSWGGGYNATFQLTLTDEMLKGGSLEGWSLQVGLNNPNAVVSTGWLDGFNGTVTFDPATGVFTNAGQDYQPELHAGDVIQFSIQVQNTGFNRDDFAFSFQDLDPVPAGAAETGAPAIATAVLDTGMSADGGDVSAVSVSAALDWSDSNGAQISAAPDSTEGGAQRSAAAAAPTEDTVLARAGADESGSSDDARRQDRGRQEHDDQGRHVGQDRQDRDHEDQGRHQGQDRQDHDHDDQGRHLGQDRQDQDHEDQGRHQGQDRQDHDHDDQGRHLGQDHHDQDHHDQGHHDQGWHLGQQDRGDAAPDAGHAAAASSHSTANPYLELVQAPAEDHLAAQPAAEGHSSGAADYLHMAGGAEHATQEPPPPDHLFADAQVEHGIGPDAHHHEAQPDAAHDAAAAAPEPLPMDDDHGQHGQGH